MFEKKLDSAFKILAQQIESEEDLGTFISAIGQSSDAKWLGNEAEKLVEFTTKCAFLFFPYENSLKMLSDYLGSAPVQDEIEKTESPVKSRRVVEALQGMSSTYQELVDDDEMEPAFQSEDRGRFLALLVLSLSAFVDVFTNRLLNRVLEREDVCSHMVELLEEELGDFLSQKDLALLGKKPHEVMKKIVRRQAPRNAYRKMNFILGALKITYTFNEIATEYELNVYQKRFNEFLKVRQKVAHGDPCPPVEDFSNQFIRKGFSKILEPLQANSHPITQQPFYQTIMEWFANQMPMFAASMRLPIMAIAYPLMVDIAVDLKLASY